MHVIVPQEDRKDRAYWGKPFALRLYLRVLYALAAFLYAGVFFGMFPIPFITQGCLAGVVSLYVLLFRMIHPNGFGWSEKFSFEKLKAEKELSEGNTDGVPEALQKVMHYPTAEELEEQRAEAERQKAEWEELKRTLRAEREAKKARKAARDERKPPKAD